jgi:hypothetical protein
MADVSLTLNTNEYPLAIVDGTTLTLSLSGPAGPSGPNTVTTNTLTDLNGYIYGDGTNIIGATDASSTNVGGTLVERDESGDSSFNSITVYDTDQETSERIYSNNFKMFFGSAGAIDGPSKALSLGDTSYLFPSSPNGNVALTGIDQTFSGAIVLSNISVKLTTIPTYASNAAASSLATGSVYKTSTGELRIKY